MESKPWADLIGALEYTSPHQDLWFLNWEIPLQMILMHTVKSENHCHRENSQVPRSCFWEGTKYPDLV